MSSLFERTLQRAEKHVDKLFADEELFKLTPYKEVRNGTWNIDPDRDETDGIKGIFANKGLQVFVGNAEGPDRISSSPRISIRDEYLPYRVQLGDRFTRNATDIIYEVKSIDPDGLGRQVYLVEEK